MGAKHISQHIEENGEHIIKKMVNPNYNCDLEEAYDFLDIYFGQMISSYHENRGLESNDSSTYSDNIDFRKDDLLKAFKLFTSHYSSCIELESTHIVVASELREKAQRSFILLVNNSSYGDSVKADLIKQINIAFT